MPWLPMYLLAGDVPDLLRLLSNDAELAFIVPDGVGRWIATTELADTPPKRIALWHVPSGPLPLSGCSTSESRTIRDPWSGWVEQRQGADPSTPFFGAGHTGIFWLNLRLLGNEHGSICGISSFEWIGNRYAIIGNPASPQTERCWKRLRRQVDRRTQRVPRKALGSSGTLEIFAFPIAHRQLEAGSIADLNP
jgi:hypothetical protein